MDKHTILIVDDEVGVLNSLKRVLQSEDREIFLAESVDEAEEILKQHGEVEVIICDNRFSNNILGINFLTKIKRLYPDTIRILTTAYPDLATAMEAINKAHIWRYILKPIEIEELKTLVNQAFDYYRILKENRLLLQIARQQAEWIKILREKYPEVVSKEVRESTIYTVDERRVSEVIAEFMKKYYPQQKK